MAKVEVSNQVATITIDNCAELSRHTELAGRSLRDAIIACGDRDDIKVLVLRSAGPDFCAASKQQSASVPACWNESYASSAGLYQSLCFSKKVTITAVQGECADAGSLLVLCSDLTVADPRTKFHSPFHVLPESNFVLAALTMRLNRAKTWMLGGLPLDAAAALDAGLINRISKADTLAEALSMARSAARIPLDGIAMSKLMIETCLDSQGVGQDFYMAGFYAGSIPSTANL